MNTRAVLRTLDGDGDRPTMRLRQAGDDQVLVDFGEGELDLLLNLRVHAFRTDVQESRIAGVVEAAPGFRSLMIGFDPDRIDRDALLDELTDRHRALPALSSMILPSRIVELPIAFDDEATREAIQKYRISTRPDAPNVVDGDNIDYAVRYNGFPTREEFYSTFLSTTWWNAFIGYYPGLPSLYALDPRTQLSVPKYNPTRMWTPEGAVGIGGPCVVVYPLESPGGYQLFGRTVPIGEAHLGPGEGRDGNLHNLLRAGDRVRFVRVTERELLALRQSVFEGTYTYQVEDGVFAVAQYLAEVERLAPNVADVAASRAVAATRVEVP